MMKSMSQQQQHAVLVTIHVCGLFAVRHINIYYNIITFYHGQGLQIMLKYEISFYLSFNEQGNG